ncbi:helix-turn-helix domain-containing protein [Deinococcus arenicola]|uniref:Helix-turn-helix domain-containing protein n=1 Tax=Deinococcus arenicola TaxID=2994950 RepID=A0ABU4DLK3_9DEIO|nr:helix-turn-helix domain-containing protein [Deinococcus sp. ZS9-10]MDV6373313.1 helix-turn-helix domain-containing protein [Deinococcus sp. ZS9-10]
MKNTDEQKFMMISTDLINKDYLSTLSGNAIKVYLVLMKYSDNDSGLAWPSIFRICDDSGIRKKETVRAALDDLIVWGLIKQTTTGGGGKGSNRYIVASGLYNRRFEDLSTPTEAEQEKIIKRNLRIDSDNKRKNKTTVK